MEDTKKSKRPLLIVIIIIVVLIAAALIWYFGYKVPQDNAHAEALGNYISAVPEYNDAVAAYNEEANEYNKILSAIEEKNAILSEAVDEAQEDLNSDLEPYDVTTKERLSDEIGAALRALVEAPESKQNYTPLEVTESVSNLKTEDLNVKVTNIKAESTKLASAKETIASNKSALSLPDYSSVLTDLDEAKIAFHDSVAVLQQVTNPTEDFVVSRLTELENVGVVAPATEDNDPNGQLNKPGGYTAAVFFSSPLVVDEYGFYTGNPIEDGTSGGGSVEVYENVDNAIRRNDYLASFDGTVLASGSHTVVGTCIVRTSHDMAASKQKALEAEIIEVLTRLDK
jgi:flagellar basal body-associated protein FliL